MPEIESKTALLPHAVPANPYRRLLLFAVRRMASGGITDAHAAHALFTGFGLSYRRPLVLLRALMAELSRVSARSLRVAPCCCPRMTDDEAALIELIALSADRAETVHDRFATLLHLRNCVSVASSAQAVALAFMDLGMPLSDACDSCNRDELF